MGAVWVVVVELAGVVEVLPVAALANAAPPPAIAPVTTSVAATRVGLTFIDPPLWLKPERCANSLTTCRKRRRINRDCVRNPQRPGDVAVANPDSHTFELLLPPISPQRKGAHEPLVARALAGSLLAGRPMRSSTGESGSDRFSVLSGPAAVAIGVGPVTTPESSKRSRGDWARRKRARLSSWPCDQRGPVVAGVGARSSI